MMKPLVIYHKGCMDGAGAALAAWLKFGESAEYRAASYGDPAPTSDEGRGREIYILDFSYPRAELERLAQHYKLIVLDHHKTAQADLEGLPYCTFDMERSGAMMAWKFFHPIARVPELIEYVQDRDLWQWKLFRSKEVSACLAATGALKDFRILHPFLKITISDLGREGSIILRVERQMVERIVATAAEVQLFHRGTTPLAGEEGPLARVIWHDEEIPHPALAAASCVLQSEVGEALANACNGVGVVWYFHGPSKKYRVSLRSRKSGIDVSAIAKLFGGGGHQAAAGFECEELPWR
jgi:hypothetical protein